MRRIRVRHTKPELQVRRIVRNLGYRYLAFSARNQALAFERYLKTGSGIAFAKKRLRPSLDAT